MRSLVTYIAIAVLAVCIGFQSIHQWRSQDAEGRPAIVVRDFGAFYCAGAARDAGENAYLKADFDDCGGRRHGHAPVRDPFDSPAPLPGYDIALFAILAKLPYATAAYFWLAISLIAVFGGAILLARCTNVPAPIVAVSFSLIALTATGWGQLTPVALGALCAAAFAVERGRMTLAGVAILVVAIEPHLGIPAALAALLLLPGTRATIAGGYVVLAIASLVALGVDPNVAYVTHVTPLHVMAEVPMSNQYSLTWLAHALGASDDLAVRLGSVSYFIMVLIGLIVARRAAIDLKSGAAAILLPVAGAVVGGPFIHVNQLVLALPAVLLFAGRRYGSQPLLWACAILLAVIWWVPQWQTHPYTPARLESVLVAAILGFYAMRKNLPRWAWVGAAAAVFSYLGVSGTILHTSTAAWNGPESARAYAQVLGDNVRYASGAYGVIVRENYELLTRFSTQTIISKLPYWLAPILLIATIAWQSFVSKSRSLSA